MIDSVRITEKGRDQLIRLKRYTGIQQWNILGRWALCVSLSEKTTPSADYAQGDNALEIAWKVFGGQEAEIYWALIRERCRRDGLDSTDVVVADQLRLHLHRGISYLAGDKDLRSVHDLLIRATK